MDNNDHLIASTNKVVGLKQTVRSIENGKAKLVYIASDADRRLIVKLKDLANMHQVKYHMVDSMLELGKMAGLKIEASACCILKD